MSHLETAHDVLEQLQSIQSQLKELADSAHTLIHSLPQQFGSIKDQAEAYRVYDFGTSVNRYDTTLDVIIERIENRIEEIGNDPEEE